MHLGYILFEMNPLTCALLSLLLFASIISHEPGFQDMVFLSGNTVWHLIPNSIIQLQSTKRRLVINFKSQDAHRGRVGTFWPCMELNWKVGSYLE